MIIGRVAAAIGSAALMTGLAVIAQTPAAASVTVKIQSVTVLARGAAVDLRVTVTCNDKDVVESGSQWEIRQVKGQRVVMGYGGDNHDYVYDSRRHTRVLRVYPQGGIFKSTLALVYFGYYSCPGDDNDSVGDCTDAEVTAEMRLRR